MSYKYPIGHKQKKHYPDMQLIRRQAKHVCLAVQKLAGLGIEVQVINFKAHTPVIEVANCPSVMALRSESIGQGSTSEDLAYVKKSAQVCGCQVVWSEVL